MTTTPALFVVHAGSGTIINADECRLIRTTDPDQLEAGVASGAIGPRSGNPVPDPLTTLHFSPAAIREHYESIDAGEPSPNTTAVAGMDDETLRGIADTALGDDRIYETFHTILEAAVAEWVEDHGGDAEGQQRLVRLDDVAGAVRRTIAAQPHIHPSRVGGIVAEVIASLTGEPDPEH